MQKYIPHKKQLSRVMVAVLIVVMASALMTPTDVFAAPKKISIKYNVNGGQFKATAHKDKKSLTKKIKRGKKLGTLPGASRTGYKLSGWYTKKSGGKKVSKNTKYKSGRTLYARWTPSLKKDKYEKIMEVILPLGGKKSLAETLPKSFPEFVHESSTDTVNFLNVATNERFIDNGMERSFNGKVSDAFSNCKVMSFADFKKAIGAKSYKVDYINNSITYTFTYNGTTAYILINHKFLDSDIQEDLDPEKITSIMNIKIFAVKL